MIGSKKLEANYRIVQSEPPAAGHPGFPPMPPPPVPPKSSIQVDEYETKKEKDGKEKRVKRDKADMDRERDSEHKKMSQEYNVKKQNYDRDIANYKELFNAWQQREQFRQNDVAKRLEKIKASSARLFEEAKQAEEARKSASEDLLAIREEVKEKRWGLTTAEMVVKSMTPQSPGSAICQACLNLISIADQKQKLISSFVRRDSEAKK